MESTHPHIRGALYPSICFTLFFSLVYGGYPVISLMVSLLAVIEEPYTDRDRTASHRACFNPFSYLLGQEPILEKGQDLSRLNYDSYSKTLGWIFHRKHKLKLTESQCQMLGFLWEVNTKYHSTPTMFSGPSPPFILLYPRLTNIFAPDLFPKLGQISIETDINATTPVFLL